MRADGVNPAAVHHDDSVRVLHRGGALRDDDLRRLGDIGLEASADERVGFGIHGARGIVQNEDLRLLQQRPCDAKPLLLPAGHVGAALLDVGVVFVREAADEFIRLRQPAGLDQLLVGGVRDCPSAGSP